jgi:hypothetical protein
VWGIDIAVARLATHNDDGLVERVSGNCEEMLHHVDKYLYCQ